jgi:aminoglycoside phosphotransferase (APT) family kinase protein
MARNCTDGASLSGASAVREAFRFDEARLETYLRAHVGDFSGPLTVQQFTGGQSNPTYLLSTPRRQFVLRRKPAGQLLASAHAVEREYRVMSALGAHTDVPVPRTFALCNDESVIGTRFFVMERVEGRIFWDTAFPEIKIGNRPGYFDAMNATLLFRADQARLVDGASEVHKMVLANLYLESVGPARSREFWRWGV